MHSAQNRALFLGGLGACPRQSLKIRYFEIESGGTFCKIHTVMFISHDYASVPTTLNIKQVKSQGGNSKPRGPVPLPAPPQINPDNYRNSEEFMYTPKKINKVKFSQQLTGMVSEDIYIGLGRQKVAGFVVVFQGQNSMIKHLLFIRLYSSRMDIMSA